MKKFLVVLVAIAMMLVATLSVSAADITNVTNNNTATADVSVVFVDSTGNVTLTPATVYNVTVQFGTLEAKWKVNNVTGAEGMVWDPSTHTYKEGSTSGTNVTFETPDAISTAVTVTNHSNAAVAVVANFSGTKTSTVNNATATLSDGDTTLKSAAEVAYGDTSKAPATTYSISFSGTPTDPTAGFTIGTITVSISAAQ